MGIRYDKDTGSFNFTGGGREPLNVEFRSGDDGIKMHLAGGTLAVESNTEGAFETRMLVAAALHQGIAKTTEN